MIGIDRTRAGGAGDSHSDTIIMLMIVLSMMKNILLGIVKMIVTLNNRSSGSSPEKSDRA